MRSAGTAAESRVRYARLERALSAERSSSCSSLIEWTIALICKSCYIHWFPHAVRPTTDACAGCGRLPRSRGA